MAKKKIIMLGTAFDTMGGIPTVVNVYREAGLFELWPILYISTHRDGSRVIKLYTFLLAIFRFIIVLASGSVGLVHAHTASRSSFWRKSIFFILCFIFKRPVIFHLHGAEFKMFYDLEASKTTKFIIRFILNRMAVIIVLSPQWAEIMSNISENKNIVKIYNPIQVDIKHSEAPVKENYTLLFLGRFGKRKGIFDLLKAFSDVHKRVPNIELLCGGDGDLAGVEQMAKELLLGDRVHILGWVTGEAKIDLFSTADIYILPTYNEGLPMGILEAMASGLPVVSTPVGGIPDAIEDGVEGFLIQPGDVDALAEAIEKLLTDGELREKMGRAAQQKVIDCFTPERILPQLEALYSKFGIEPKDGAKTKHI